MLQEIAWHKYCYISGKSKYVKDVTIESRHHDNYN